MSDLFRREVVAHKSDRLSGDVSIAIPISWQSIGFLLSAIVIAATGFLSFASYSRVETVAGLLTPAAGVASILPTRSGTVTRLPVRDGQWVVKGAILAEIRAEEDSVSGLSAAAKIEEAIALQDRNLAAQAAALASAERFQLSQIDAQRAGMVAEISQLETQIAAQKSLIAAAQGDYDRARSIFDRGFISARDIQQRQETLLVRLQGLAQIRQTLAQRQAALIEAERNVANIMAQSRAQRASLAANRASIAQQAANAAGSRSYVLRAPLKGKVTALTTRLGQPVNPQSAVMAIVPTGSMLRAELAVPSSAIGFVKVGQKVRLAIDAFPYQRFGTVEGRVAIVAASSITTQGPNSSTVLVYPVTVTLDRTNIEAYGRSEELVAGMTLTARIVTQKQSLLEWLFEPLFAVRRR